MDSSPAENSSLIPEPVVAVPSEGVRAQDEVATKGSKSPPTGQPSFASQAYDELKPLLASAVLHGVALLLLSLWFFPLGAERPLGWLQGALSEQAEVLELDTTEFSNTGGELSLAQEQAVDLAEAQDLGEAEFIEPTPLDLPTTVAPATRPASLIETFSPSLFPAGSGLIGRNAESRRSLALSGGGSRDSEAAVERGLAWLAAHQYDDGGWRFDLESHPACQGACRHSGFRASTTDSTGLALLCFLGAGYTQHEGPYQETVANGLYYLQQKMLVTTFGGDLRDRSIVSGLNNGVLLVQKNGDMYSHAIATLALTEAYALTRDENLAGPAQLAVDFIVNAQHEQGGWRYEPKQPGDMSVTGFQVTALKSALYGKLKIPREVWYRVSDFVDGVQDEQGVTYGYKTPSNKKRSMSAVGLFTRMILGWPHEHPALVKGVTRLGEQAPHQNHMYFNYYTSQVLRHYGGPAWKRWNPKMRDYLVKLQATQGHETGSWYIDESWSDRGGRLYSTAMAILTLEVYYRYIPMYQEAFTNDAP